MVKIFRKQRTTKKKKKKEKKNWNKMRRPTKGLKKIFFKPPTTQHIMTHLPATPPACRQCVARDTAETAAPARREGERRRHAGDAGGRGSCGRPGKASAATALGCDCTDCSAASAGTQTEQGLSPCMVRHPPLCADICCQHTPTNFSNSLSNNNAPGYKVWFSKVSK